MMIVMFVFAVVLTLVGVPLMWHYYKAWNHRDEPVTIVGLLLAVVPTTAALFLWIHMFGRLIAQATEGMHLSN